MKPKGLGRTFNSPTPAAKPANLCHLPGPRRVPTKAHVANETHAPPNPWEGSVGRTAHPLGTHPTRYLPLGIQLRDSGGTYLGG